MGATVRVLISGAGVAGLALARFLERSGVEADLIDKTTAWGPAGYGISVWGSGLRAFEKLGLIDRVLEENPPVDAWVFCDHNGRVLRRAKVGLPDRPALTRIHRADLHALLREGLEPRIEMGVAIESAEPGPHDVRVRLSTGEERVYDLLIGADGLRSQVRQLCFDSWSVTDGGTDWWSFWAPEGVYTPPGQTEVLGRDGKAFLIAPAGRRIEAAVAVARTPGDDGGTPLERLRAVISSEDWVMGELVASLDEEAPLFHTRNFEVHVPDWRRGRVLLIGDAAHALHPVLGMGASLALEDAWLLAEELESGPVDEALERFVARRKPRVQRFQRLAAVTRRGFFPSSAILAAIRNFAIEHTSFMERGFQRQAREMWTATL